MKMQLLFLTLIFISTFAKANALEDSLIANIGKKAKVIFYAENKADLNEIAKYDLNKLFAEVRKRSEKNFSNNEEVTLREADDLKNREVNTTVSTKKWLKNMNLNLFVGLSSLDANVSLVSWYTTNLGSYQKEIYLMEGKNSPVFGIGGFYTKTLSKRNHSELSLKYGLGIDIVTSKTNLRKIGYITGINIESVDTLYKYNRTDRPTVQLFSTNIYTQIMPNFNLVNRKGQQTFSFGIGVKLGLNVNNFLHKNSSIEKLTYLSYSPYVSIKNTTLQTAFIANIGYKYINLFCQITPNVSIIKVPILSSQLNFENPFRQTKANLYTIGLRFGK